MNAVVHDIQTAGARHVAFPDPATLGRRKQRSRRADRQWVVQQDGEDFASLVLVLDRDPQSAFPEDGAALHIDLLPADARRLAENLVRYAEQQEAVDAAQS